MFQEQGHLDDAARVLQTVSRLIFELTLSARRRGSSEAREWEATAQIRDVAVTEKRKAYAKILFDCLRMSAMNHFSRIKAGDEIASTERWELLGFRALISASYLEVQSTPHDHSQLGHGITMAACRLAYRMRDDGRPLPALRTLTHAVDALAHITRSVSARAHLYNDLCNLFRGLGSLDQALTSCSLALELADQLGAESDGKNGIAVRPGQGEDARQGAPVEEGEGTLEAGSLSLFHFNLAKVLIDRKDAQGAMRHWQRTIELAPDVDTLISMGLAAWHAPAPSPAPLDTPFPPPRPLKLPDMPNSLPPFA